MTIDMVLVTGASDSVGWTIVRLLAERVERVWLLDLRRTNDLAEGVDYVEADINDAALVEKAMQGIRYVHHLVALMPLDKRRRATTAAK